MKAEAKVIVPTYNITDISQDEMLYIRDVLGDVCSNSNTPGERVFSLIDEALVDGSSRRFATGHNESTNTIRRIAPDGD
jgi:hypothetical protein